MPCAGSRWCRAAAAVLVLVATLLACGPLTGVVAVPGSAAGAVAGPGSEPGWGSGAGSKPGSGAGYAGAEDGAGPGHYADGAGAGSGRVPGCGSSDDEGGLAPAVPPRPCSPGELLAALHVARAAPGTWGPDGTAPRYRPDRGPPPLAAPSPLDLSILRV